MICLRHFIAEDIPVLQSFYPERTLKELQQMLHEWHQMKLGGRYFEMFAVCSEGKIVGEISLYEYSKSTVGICLAMDEPCPHSDDAAQAVKMAVCRAKENGFRFIIQQIRTDMIAI